MNLKVRLAIMNFMEFAVWGAYLTCMGNYLGVAGLGSQISWFYAIQGIVSIFMPTLMGIVADKYIQPQRLLGLCHLLAGGFMLGCWWMGVQAGFGQELPDKDVVRELRSVGRRTVYVHYGRQLPQVPIYLYAVLRIGSAQCAALSLLFYTAFMPCRETGEERFTCRKSRT